MLFQLHSHTVEAGLFSIPLLTNWLIESCSCHCFIRPKHWSSENLLIIKGWENRQSPVKAVLRWNSVSGRASYFVCSFCLSFSQAQLIISWSAEHNFCRFHTVLQCWEPAVHSHSHPTLPGGRYPPVLCSPPRPGTSCTDRAVARPGLSVSAPVK